MKGYYYYYFKPENNVKMFSLAVTKLFNFYNASEGTGPSHESEKKKIQTYPIWGSFRCHHIKWGKDV